MGQASLPFGIEAPQKDLLNQKNLYFADFSNYVLVTQIEHKVRTKSLVSQDGENEMTYKNLFNLKRPFSGLTLNVKFLGFQFAEALIGKRAAKIDKKCLRRLFGMIGTGEK